jgi:hypothetical protein
MIVAKLFLMEWHRNMAGAFLSIPSRHPQHVRLHPNMPYFCFIPTVEEAFQITPEKSWVSRYRIVVSDGDPNPEELNKIQRAFAKIPFSDAHQASDSR